MGFSLFQVDAFTDSAFGGNPAAVCLLDKEMPDQWHQDVAREMNLSETAFIRKNDDGSWHLRWFTPTVEVPLCGHATLASAHVLLKELEEKSPIKFQTLSGELVCTETNDEGIELNFPVNPVQSGIIPPNLERAIGGVKALTASMGKEVIVVEVADREDLLSIRPHYQMIADSPWGDLFIVTCESHDDQYDFRSRVFAPKCGIPEDPVTGSAHCALAFYWNKRLRKTEFHAFQDSARGGDLGVRLDGDRVYLSGNAVTVLKGELVV